MQPPIGQTAAAPWSKCCSKSVKTHLAVKLLQPLVKKTLCAQPVGKKPSVKPLKPLHQPHRSRIPAAKLNPCCRSNQSKHPPPPAAKLLHVPYQNCHGLSFKTSCRFLAPHRPTARRCPRRPLLPTRARALAKHAAAHARVAAGAPLTRAARAAAAI